jgi:hypothetical protein
VEIVYGSGRQGMMDGYFINGHGPYTGSRESVPVNDSGMPESCMEEAPLEDSCEMCRMKANLRRWAG